jgi:accessory gene regulator protein AgrB
MALSLLIDLNNTVGPWLSEICAAFWLITSLALLRTWHQSRTSDALIIFSYLTLLVIVANIPASWGDLSALAVIHLLLFTALVWAHGAHGLLDTNYGSRMQNLAASIVFIDSAFLCWKFPTQYHAWLLMVIFIAMCLYTLYVCLKSPDNGGNLGKRHVDNKYYKALIESIKI